MSGFLYHVTEVKWTLLVNIIFVLLYTHKDTVHVSMPQASKSLILVSQMASCLPLIPDSYLIFDSCL